jgi:hypothetical protein
MRKGRRLVSLPLKKYRKVAADFCSDQGATKEYSLSYTTEEQRRAGQKDQYLVCNGSSGNDSKRALALCIACLEFTLPLRKAILLRGETQTI